MRSIPVLIELWDRFGDIPIDVNDEIQKPFLHFPVNTNRFLIWSWFEEQNPEFKIIEHLI
jgi:hypothetical protein